MPASLDSDAYKYERLSDPEKQIRLVTLHSGRFHAPIEIEVEIKPEIKPEIPRQNQDATYDALSYAWGDCSNQVSISVLAKGEKSRHLKTIKVTRNLSMALRHLRSPEESKTLWIDALCIDQENNAEKTHQVSMMTKIYKEADQVRIWLGPEANGSDLAMKTLRRGCDKQLREDLMDKDNNRVRRALEALSRRDYWTRVWVVQEIFMARSIKIHCGQLEVDWDSTREVFSEFLESRQDLLTRNMSQNHDTPKGNTPQALGQKKGGSGEGQRKGGSGKIAQKSSVSGATLRTRIRPFNNVIHLAEGRSASCMRKSRWLFDILMEHRHYGATDKRDKIFSMLGLLDQPPSHNSAQPVSTRLCVDYNLSFLDVSIRLFNYLALYPPEEEGSERNKRLLLNIVCASQPDTSLDFPTWLPDFSRDNGMVSWPLSEALGRPIYFAAQAKLSYDSRTLSIQGAEIGTTTAVTDDQDDCQATDDLSLLARLAYFLRLIPESFQGAGHFWKSFVLGEETGKRLVNALTKKPCPDTNDQILEALETVVKDGSDQSTQELTLSEMVDCPEILRAFLNEFRSKSYRRRFAVLERSMEHKTPKNDEVPKDDPEKLMAMVPEDAKKGDSLYQLGSCEYWVLLRPIVVEVPCFHFVGPVYLAETPSWLKDSKATPKWISLH